MRSTTKPSVKLGSFSFLVRLAISSLTLAGLVLRVIQLDFQPFWWDEGYSIFFSTRDWTTMLMRTAVDIHPPLYYALLKLWMEALGKSPIAIRLFSVAIGTATIPLVYVLARRRLGARAGMLSARIVALSPFFVYYSQEVRMYGLVTLLCLLSVYLFFELMTNRPNSPANPVLVGFYILATAAALYSQYYAASVLVFEILVGGSIISRDRQKSSRHHRMRSWGLAWAAIILLYAPWLVFAGAQLYGYVTAKVTHEAYVPLDPIQFIGRHVAALSVGHLTNWTSLAWAAIAFAVIIGLGLFGRDHSDQGHPEATVAPRWYIGLYLLIPFVFTYGVNLLFPFHPVRVERLLLIAAPAFCVLLARGILILLDRNRAIGAVALMAVVSACSLSLYDFYSVPRYPNDDYRPLIEQVRLLAAPNDVFVAVYPWQIGYLETYYSGPPVHVVEPPADQWVNSPALLEQDIESLLRTHKRLWLPALQTLGRIVEDALDGYLRPRSYTVLDAWYSTTRLELFAKIDDPPPMAQSLTVRDHAIPWGLPDNVKFAGGDVVPIWFEWSHLSNVGLQTSLRLLDANGHLWAQDDRALESGRQRIGFSIPYGMPSGSYELQALLYSPSQPSTPTPASYRLSQLELTASDDERAYLIGRRLSVGFANGIQLVGYSPLQSTLRPGDPAGLVFFWKTLRPVTGDYDVLVQLIDGQGNTAGESTGPPARGILNSSRWTVGVVIRDPREVSLKGITRNGDISVRVGLIDAKTGERAKTTNGEEVVQVARAMVVGRPHYFAPPKVPRATNYRFGETATLIGYNVASSDSTIVLDLYWRAAKSEDRSYTVYAHALQADGRIIGQSDRMPGDGTLPTSSWIKDEYLIDEHLIPITSGSVNQIELGIFDLTSGARLPTFDGDGRPLGDHVVLTP